MGRVLPGRFWLKAPTTVLLFAVATMPANAQLFKNDRADGLFCPPKKGRATLDNPCPPGMRPVQPNLGEKPDPSQPDPNKPDPNKPKPDRPDANAPDSNQPDTDRLDPNRPNSNQPNPPAAPPLQNRFDADSSALTGLFANELAQAGDFLGFFDTSTFRANDPFFTAQSITIAGTNLTGFSRTQTVEGFQVVIPAGSAAFGGVVQRNLTLNFNDDPNDSTIGRLDVSRLSVDDRRELLTFLSREGSFVANRLGLVTEADLARLTATKTGSPGNEAADLTLQTDSFLPGGFEQGQALVLPRTGVVISRFKVAEQSSPIPRDRLLLNYGWFRDAPGPGGPSDIQRVVPGFEKTFNEGFSSVEMRMPFAYTFSSNQPLNGAGQVIGSNDYELGNLNLSLKQLLVGTERFGWSAGVALELPTADDLVFSNLLYKVTRVSESVNLSPYTGFLWAPNDQIFFQSIGQISFDTNGELLYVEDRFTGGRAAGVLQDPTTLYVDSQAGVWLYRNLRTKRASELSGVAGIVELHFNQTLQGTDALDLSGGVGGQGSISGAPLVFGTAGSDLGVANLTSGLTTEFGEQSRLTCAYVVPLTRTDRQFDSELQVQFAYYFDKRGASPRIPRGRVR